MKDEIARVFIQFSNVHDVNCADCVVTSRGKWVDLIVDIFKKHVLSPLPEKEEE